MIAPSEDFQTLEQVSRRSLRMYDLTKRERLICEVIIDFSFAKGHECAVIPELEAFIDLTGLDKGDVSRALQLLLARGIVQRSGPMEARVYAFIPAAAFWSERKPLFDMERAIARAAWLEQMNELAPAFDPRGQKMLPLPADEPGLVEGMAMAAREEALRGSDSQIEIGDSPICERVSQIGESPTTGGVGKSPTASPSTRARETLRKNATVHNVTQRRQFADEEKNFVFENLEHLAAGPDFEQYRGAWVRRVRDFPGVVREAIGDVKIWKANSRNKLRKPVGALIFSRCKAIAKGFEKDFRLW